MKVIIAVLLYLGMLGTRSMSYGQTAHEEKDPFLAEMFKYANEHNIKSLEEIGKEVTLRNDRRLTAVYSLALYIAAPQIYKQQYVENFPLDSDGMRYFNEKLSGPLCQDNTGLRLRG